MGSIAVLSSDVTDLLSLEYKGLFEDQQQCFVQLSHKRESGDEDTPPALTQGALFDFSPALFIWVTQQHIDNGSAHLVAKDIMSNITTAGLSETYRQMLDMLANAGHVHSAAQIWRAGVATDIDVYRSFLSAKRSVDRYDSRTDAQREKLASKSPPDRHQRGMARDFATKKRVATDAVEAFETWAARYCAADQQSVQIALWIEELHTDKKPKLPAPDKAAMSEDLFWEIIARAQSDTEIETCLNLHEQLVCYSGKAIKNAGKLMRSYLNAAYREDIWALAYLLEDGCSEDAFDDFRGWMVLQGRATFEAILDAPDMFDPCHADGAQFAAGSSLQAAFENAYLSRMAKPLILPRAKFPKLEFEEERVAELLPNISARLAGA